MNEIKLIDCLKRKIDDTFLVVYAIKNDVNIKRGDIIDKIDIYTFVGVNKKGIRQLIGIYQDKSSNTRYWLDTFELFKNRGLKTILFFAVDDNHSLKRAAKVAFPSLMFVDAITYIAANFNKFIAERNSTKAHRIIDKIYSAYTLSDYKGELEMFNKSFNNLLFQKFEKKYLSNVADYYKYSYNIRTLLFAPSANMRIYDKIRLSFDSNKRYINDLNEVYEALENMERAVGYVTFQKKKWTMILNDIMELYPEMDLI